MQQDKLTPTEPEGNGEGEGHYLLNIGKMLFLVVVLVAAWYILEWLMGGK